MIVGTSRLQRNLFIGYICICTTYRVDVRSSGTGTYSDGLYQDMYLASDVEGLIVPEHYAKQIYDSFNVTTSKTDPDLYQKECSKIEQHNDYIDFYFSGTKYHLEAKYLFTPVSLIT
jgi:hypothetical protein